MNTKKLIAVLVIAIVSLSTMNAQKMDHSKMKKDTTKMKMDHSKMEMKHNSSKMNMDHSKIAKVYTCSMHPEIVSDKSGKCPKCGMKLMEKKTKVKKMQMKKMKMKKMDNNKEVDQKEHKH